MFHEYIMSGILELKLISTHILYIKGKVTMISAGNKYITEPQSVTSLNDEVVKI